MAVKRVSVKIGGEIKFSNCPIDKHKGEIWTKLEDLNLDEPCEIVDITYEWSDNLPMGFWKDDTFQDFDRSDIRKLMATFNQGLENVPGIILTLDHMGGEFTTFRTWTVSKDHYYQNLWADGKRLIIRTPSNPRKIGQESLF